MLVQQQASRARRKHNKVSTGCLTCKKRRVKCDEKEPGCRRCQRANLFCPGYNPPTARIFESSSRDGRTPHLDSHQTGLLTTLQPQSRANPPVILTKAIDLRLTWQKSLLDSFLTIWLPRSLARQYATRNEYECIVPTSGWPSVTWKLAKKQDDSFVAHALLCLTLCVISSPDRRSQSC